MKSVCRWCDEVFIPKVKRGRNPMCCSSKCNKEYSAYYNKQYCATNEWKGKRKDKRDARKLTNSLEV